MRLDLYLKTARLFKRRTEAQKSIDSGKVLLNDRRTKPAHAVAPGDRLLIHYANHDLEVEVLATPERPVPRSAAADLYHQIARTPRDRV